eukprot:TRINITY_DN45991_c0_g1_i1.p2 TRINITY_DN45991_c0_g1~~TRINITY_DN45991_c0_g1_i1.p2  ORF type:complete len:134 (-),score=22.53 TRINITY_DN45991_c0_g1_i1:109-510(-)
MFAVVAAVASLVAFLAVPAVHAASNCLDAHDSAIFNKTDVKTLNDDLESCSKSCLGRESCVTSCMQKDLNLTQPCAACYGICSSCVASNCWTTCTFHPDGDSCKNCALKNCVPALDTCTGRNSSAPAYAIVRK